MTPNTRVLKIVDQQPTSRIGRVDKQKLTMILYNMETEFNNQSHKKRIERNKWMAEQNEQPTLTTGASVYQLEGPQRINGIVKGMRNHSVHAGNVEKNQMIKIHEKAKDIKVTATLYNRQMNGEQSDKYEPYENMEEHEFDHRPKP